MWVFFFSFFFVENIIGRLYNIQNSKLCFRDMKIMSRRNGGDFGKQLVLLRDIIFISRKHSLLFSIYTYLFVCPSFLVSELENIHHLLAQEIFS